MGGDAREFGTVIPDCSIIRWHAVAVVGHGGARRHQATRCDLGSKMGAAGLDHIQAHEQCDVLS